MHGCTARAQSGGLRQARDRTSLSAQVSWVCIASTPGPREGQFSRHHASCSTRHNDFVVEQKRLSLAVPAAAAAGLCRWVLIYFSMRYFPVLHEKAGDSGGSSYGGEGQEANA